MFNRQSCPTVTFLNGLPCLKLLIISPFLEATPKNVIEKKKSINKGPRTLSLPFDKEVLSGSANGISDDEDSGAEVSRSLIDAQNSHHGSPITIHGSNLQTSPIVEFLSSIKGLLQSSQISLGVTSSSQGTEQNSSIVIFFNWLRWSKLSGFSSVLDF